MMDATWKVSRLYVTSILIVSVPNIGIPVAVAFRPVEDKALYGQFYQALLKIGFEKSDWPLKCDQGSALKHFWRSHRIRRLVCLWHLLISLRQTPAAWRTGYLVQCRCSHDFEPPYKALGASFSQAGEGRARRSWALAEEGRTRVAGWHDCDR
jgi:hypothetical protein